MKAKRTEHVWFYRGSQDTNTVLAYDNTEMLRKLFSNPVRAVYADMYYEVVNLDYYKVK